MKILIVIYLFLTILILDIYPIDFNKLKND